MSEFSLVSFFRNLLKGRKKLIKIYNKIVSIFLHILLLMLAFLNFTFRFASVLILNILVHISWFIFNLFENFSLIKWFSPHIMPNDFILIQIFLNLDFDWLKIFKRFPCRCCFFPLYTKFKATIFIFSMGKNGVNDTGLKSSFSLHFSFEIQSSKKYIC